MCGRVGARVVGRKLARTCSPVTLPSSLAMVTRAVLPVKSSAPDMIVMKRPKGSPNAPMMMLLRPGLVAARPGHAPPTERRRKAPKPMWQPESMPRPKIFFAGRLAFLMPAATAPSKPSCGLHHAGEFHQRPVNCGHAGVFECGTLTWQPACRCTDGVR